MTQAPFQGATIMMNHQKRETHCPVRPLFDLQRVRQRQHQHLCLRQSCPLF